jgi:hypothetical protein
LFTSDIDSNKNIPLMRSIIVYMILSVAAIIINNIYTMFGHGVTSAAMTWMFLYPLLGGTLVMLLIKRIAPTAVKAPGFRLAFNLYNSGIAVLTVASFLRGILEIAGADSPYTIPFYIVGIAFAAAGFLVFLAKPLRHRIIGSD